MVYYEYGSLAGDWLRNAASAARNGACSLYTRFPRWAVGSGVALNSPAWKIAQGIADSVCKGTPNYVPPPPPSLAYTGGQCPVTYRVISRYRVKDLGVFTGYDVFIPGPLGGSKPGTGQAGVGYGIIGSDGAGGTKFYYLSPAYTTAKQLAEKIDSFSIVSVTRQDGQSDNCGNPQPQYPPEKEGEPEASDLNETKPIPDSGGNNYSVPFRFSPIFIDNDFNIKVDVGGIGFTFDAGGVSINYGNKNSGDGSPGSFDRPPTLPPGLGDALDDLADKIDEVNEKADQANDKLDDAAKRERERERRPPEDPDYEEDEKEPGDSSEDGVEKMKWLIVELTKLPSQGNVIVDTEGQIIAYAGWVEFRIGGKGLPRQQLNYPLNIFPVPESVDGYAVTFTKGAKGKVTVVKEKVQ